MKVGQSVSLLHRHTLTLTKQGGIEMNKIRAPKTLLVLILGVSLCLPCSAYALSQNRAQRNHPFILERIVEFLRFIAELELTEGQKSTLKTLIAETGDAIKPLVDEIMELRGEMDEALLSDTVDAVEASQLHTKILSLKSEISTIVLNTQLEGAQILTPEQRLLLLEKKEEHRERMQAWRERFREWWDFLSKLLHN